MRRLIIPFCFECNRKKFDREYEDFDSIHSQLICASCGKVVTKRVKEKPAKGLGRERSS